jgi:ERCC4-type nuclease
MLLLDSRAGSIDLHGYMPGSQHTVLTQLRSGDAAWIGNGPSGKVDVGVEVKHLPDLLQSLEDGRFPAKQLLNLREDYDIAYLLLQDRISRSRDGQLLVWMPRDASKLGMDRYKPQYYEKGRWVTALFGQRTPMLYSTFCKRRASIASAGVRMLWAGSHEEAACAVAAEYEWWRQDWGAHKSLKVFDESFVTLTKPSVVAKTIHAMVYGIGWVKAFAAAEMFGTVRRAANANEAEWRAVPGIDKVIAARAVRSATEEHMYRTVTGRGEDVGRKRKAAAR